MKSKIQTKEKVDISRKSLEKSLEYLTCPEDRANLSLDVPNLDYITEGSFNCSGCGKVYPIENGVPHFANQADEYSWGDDMENHQIVQILTESLENLPLLQAQVNSLGELLYERFKGDRRFAIRGLNRIVETILDQDGLSEDQVRSLVVSTNETRYDLEVYRGALITPYKVLASALDNYNVEDGLVLEGGCATGDCLMYTTSVFPSDFYLGVDISANLIRQAQRKSGDNTLFIRADVQLLPVRSNSVGVVIEQNIWDRLPDPPMAVEEIRRVLNSSGSLILSQCNPPQYESTDGSIVYVPLKKRLSLPQIVRKLDFCRSTYQEVIWTPCTIQDGQESLRTDSFNAF